LPQAIEANPRVAFNVIIFDESALPKHAQMLTHPCRADGQRSRQLTCPSRFLSEQVNYAAARRVGQRSKHIV
jgi:hypothetical protein